MIDLDVLLKSRLAEEDYEIPGVGTVRVRIFSWEECAKFQALTAGGKSLDQVYPLMLSAAMIDPKVTVDEARLWLGNAPGGEIETLINHVVAASGLVEGAQKSAC